MQDALRNRVFAVITITAMLLGSLSGVLAPSTASAASAGDLIKGESLSTVYYYAPDGTRYTFPDEKTYMTWYQDFDSVETISDSALADIALGGNIVYRPGTKWIKVQSNPKVYAVATDGTIHWVETEDVAIDLGGSDWASYVNDVPDVFFGDYTSGTSLTSATAYDGMMFMDGSDYYISWDGEKLLVSDLDANNMTSDFFLTGEGIDDSSLSAGDEITAEVAAIVDASQQGGVVVDVVVEGDVEISLSSSNPAGISVPTNANIVEVLSFDITAGDDATEVNEIVVSMIGLSAASDVSNVYLYEGSTRLTEARSVNSSTRMATFGTTHIALEANETRTITVKVTLSASSGDEIQFGIDSADDITADGDVDGSFPIEGEIFEVSGTSVGTITVVDTGTISDPALGANDAKIGSFKITTATEAGDVQALTLKVDNGADHDDYMLWADGAIVAYGEYIGDKLVAFDFDEEYIIAKGQNEIFELTADIGGEASETIYVYMDKVIDVQVIGADYGFPMAATITGYDNTDSTERNSSTIQGGSVTLSSSGPITGDVQVNSQDVTLLEFTITAAQSMIVKDLDVVVLATDEDDNDPFDGVDGGNSDNTGLINTSSEANITDIRIVNVDTGATLMGPLELDTTTDDATGETGVSSGVWVSTAEDAAQIIDFSDDFDMAEGETLNLAVVVDIDDSLTSGTELGAIVDISGFQAEDVNGDTICTSGCTTTDVVPSSDLQGYAQQALAASLVISLASTPGDVSTVRGVSDVIMNSFNFVAGSGGEVIVSSIIIDVYAHDTSSSSLTYGDATDADVNDFISSCSIYDNDGNLIDGPESPASTGLTVTFSSVDWTIEASENERMDVKCNLAKPSSGTDSDYFAIDMVTADGALTVVDSDNNTVTPTGDAVNGGTSPTNVVTVAQKGSLAVAVSSGTPSADFVLANTTDNHVAAFTFTATTEDFNVSTLSFTEEAAEDNGNGTDASTYANNIALVTVEYSNEEGTTVTETATMVGNEASFTGLEFFVEYGSPATIDVYVDVPATDRVSGNATSNERIEMGLSVGTGDYVATGASSGERASDPSATESNKTFVVKETVPTVSLSSSSPSGTSVPGDIEVYRFNVSASSNQDVILDELVWALSSTDNETHQWDYCDTDDTTNGHIDADIFDLYNLSEEGTSSTLAGTFTVLAADGDTCVVTGDAEEVDYVHFDLTTAEVIPAGQTYTYSLYMETTFASSTNDDVIQFTLASDPFLAAASFITASDLGDALTVTATTVPVTATTDYTVGDIICLDNEDDGCDSDDELAFVTGITSGASLTVIRGYLGTHAVAAGVSADDVDRLPSTFVWEDDGAISTSATGEDWGSYLVDSLPVTGNSLQF